MFKKRNKSSNLTDEQKAKKRERYYAKKEYYKQYRDNRKILKAEYDKKWREENKLERIQVSKKYYLENKNDPRYKEMRSVYKILNKERLNAKSRKLARLNKAKIAFKAAKKRACKLQATPKWLTEEHKKQISEFYELAHELAWLNEGEVFHVDHIIPLKGTNVCGLHVPWNLQLLPAHKNLKKSNKNLL